MSALKRIFEIVSKSQKGLTVAQIISALEEIPWAVSEAGVRSALGAMVKKGVLRMHLSGACGACGHKGYIVYSAMKAGENRDEK